MKAARHSLQPPRAAIRQDRQAELERFQMTAFRENKIGARHRTPNSSEVLHQS
jgi:hypothetical protein